MIQRKTGIWNTPAALLLVVPIFGLSFWHLVEDVFYKAKEGAREIVFYIELFVVLMIIFLIVCAFVIFALAEEGYCRLWHGRPAQNGWFDSCID